MTSPIVNSQASLALTVFQQIAGVYPSRDPGSFIGELGIFAGDFGPDGAPLASGQILSIAQNTALFSLLGTTYGGDEQDELCASKSRRYCPHRIRPRPRTSAARSWWSDWHIRRYADFATAAARSEWVKSGVRQLPTVAASQLHHQHWRPF